VLIPRIQREAGIIIEFKKVNAKRGETKDNAVAKAFQQIEEQNYAAALLERGVRQIRKLAIVFKGKQVWVREQSAEGMARRAEGIALANPCAMRSALGAVSKNDEGINMQTEQELKNVIQVYRENLDEEFRFPCFILPKASYDEIKEFFDLRLLK